jgi:hypothetical protein
VNLVKLSELHLEELTCLCFKDLVTCQYSHLLCLIAMFSHVARMKRSKYLAVRAGSMEAEKTHVTVSSDCAGLGRALGC